MSGDLKAQIEISADASGVEAGVGRAKRSLNDLGASAAASGKSAAAGFAKIGENAAGSAAKVDAATRNQINSIQRLIAATEAGDKSSRQYQESLARLRGADLNALRPYLDQLDAVNAKQKHAEESANGFGRALGSIADYAKAAAAGLAAAFSVGAIIGRVNEALDTLAKLDDVSQKTGSSIENLSRLQKVSSAFGQDFNNVDSALSKLAKGMATVDSETNKTNKALAALGVKSRDAAGALRDPSELMVEVAKRLQDYQDDASKAALATDLFGKAGADLIPYLNDLAENVDKFSGASENAAKRASEFQDKLGIMRVKSDDLYTAIASDLLPTMIDFVDALGDAKRESDQLTTGSSLTSWADDLAVGLARVVDVAKLLPSVFKAIGGSFEVVGADINVAAKKLITMNPLAFAQQVARGENPLADLAKARQERDKVLAEANAAYDRLWNNPANSMEQAMLGRIAGRNTRGEDAIDALGKLMLGGGQKKTLGYTTGTAGTQQLSEYQKLIQTINEKIAAERLELESSTELSAGQKLASQVMVSLRDKTIELTEKEKIRVSGLLEDLIATEKNNEAKKKALKVQAELSAEIAKWNNATLFDQASLEEEIAMFGKSAEARKVLVAQLKVDAEARERIDSIRKNGALPDEIALILLEAEARKKNIAAIQGEQQAIAGAEQLRQENKRFTANALADEEARAAALLDIDAELWRERIRLAGEGTEAQKLLQTQFDQWYANRQMEPVLSRWKTIISNLDNDFREGFRDMLTHGENAWKSFSKSIGNTLKTALADALYQTFLKKYVIQIVASVAGVFSGPAVANALTGRTGDTSNLMQSGDLYSMGKTLWNGFSTGFEGGFSGMLSRAWQNTGISGMGNGTPSGWVSAEGGTGFAGGMATDGLSLSGLASMAGNAFLGYGLSKGLSGGYNVKGVNEVAAIASAFAGPLAGVVGAAVNRAFGSKVVGSGVMGTITEDQFAGNAYQFKKGGWFKGDKTVPSALDAEVNSVFTNAIKGMYQNFSNLGEAVGAGGELLKGFSYEFRLALADLDAAGKEKAIQAALARVSDSMAQAFVDTFRTSIDTAQQQASRYYTNTKDGERSFAGVVVDQTRISSPLDPFIDDMIRIFDAQRAQLAGVSESEGKLAAFTQALFGLGDGLVENAGYLKVFGEALDFKKLEVAAKSGETVIDAFARLNTVFAATNAVAVTLGQNMDSAFGSLGLASTDARQRVIDLAGGIDALASGTTFFAQNFLTEAEQIAPTIKAVQDRMAELGFASVDTKDEFKELVRGLDLGSEAGAKLYGQLLAVAPAFAQVADYSKRMADEVIENAKREADAKRDAARSILDNAMLGVDSAFAAVQRSIDADRKSITASYNDAVKLVNDRIKDVTGSVGKLFGLSTSLKSTLDRMRLPSERASDRATASAEIETALAIARAGGVFPDADQLSNALNIISQPAEDLYSSFIDYQRDQLIQRAKVEELAKLTGNQLTVEEKTLKTLEDQLKSTESAYKDQMSRLDQELAYAQQQVDTLRGIRTDLMPLPAALAALSTAIGKAATAQSVISGQTGTLPDSVTGLYSNILGRAPDAAGAAFWQNALATNPKGWDGVVKDFINGALSGGTTEDKIKALAYAKANKLPGFAVGTSYVPYDMPAIVHKGEEITPRPYVDMQRADRERTNALLEQLVDENKKLRVELEQAKDSIKQMADQFDNVTEGGNAMRSEVLA